MGSRVRGRRLQMLVAGALLLGAVAAVPADAAYSPAPRQSWTANGVVFAIAVHGDRVYIGGRFTKVTNRANGQGVTRTRLAAFNASTGALITSFNASFNDDVRAIAVSPDGNTVYVGGVFSTVNGGARSRLVALDSATGAVRPAWTAEASGAIVRDLLVVGNDLYVAGTFGRINGQSRRGLAKVALSNGQLSSWHVTMSGGRPWSITPSPNGQHLIVAGAFTELGGQPRSFLGSVDLGTGATTAWHPTPACGNCTLFDVIAQGDAVYGAVGGGGGRAVRWSASTGGIQWQARGDGNVQALAYDDGIVYVGGHYGPTFAGATRHQLSAVDADNGRLLPWNPQLGGADHPGVWALVPGTSFLRVGGGFRTVGGEPQARFAEFPTS